MQLAGSLTLSTYVHGFRSIISRVQSLLVSLNIDPTGRKHLAMTYVFDDDHYALFIIDLHLFITDSSEPSHETTDATPHGTKAKTYSQDSLQGCMTLSELESRDAPLKRQIEDYSEKEEERYNQIAAHQKNTHTFAKLASKLGMWEQRIDGMGR